MLHFHITLRVFNAGGAGERVESTLSAFRHAYSQGTEMFEVDAQMTADGRVVVCHDDDLKRLTGDEVKISQLNYAGRFGVINVCFDNYSTKLHTMPMSFPVAHCPVLFF